MVRSEAPPRVPFGTLHPTADRVEGVENPAFSHSSPIHVDGAPADVFDHLGSTFIITFVRTSHASNHRTDDEDQVNAEEHEGRGKQQALTGWHGHLYDVRGRRLQGTWLNCGVWGTLRVELVGIPGGHHHSGL